MSKQSGGTFQEMLNAQTEDRKYHIIAELISKEMGNLKKAPPH